MNRREHAKKQLQSLRSFIAKCGDGLQHLQESIGGQPVFEDFIRWIMEEFVPDDVVTPNTKRLMMTHHQLREAPSLFSGRAAKKCAAKIAEFIVGSRWTTRKRIELRQKSRERCPPRFECPFTARPFAS